MGGVPGFDGVAFVATAIAILLSALASLLSTMTRKQQVEEHNFATGKDFRNFLDAKVTNMRSEAGQFEKAHDARVQKLQSTVGNFAQQQQASFDTNGQLLAKLE